MDSYTTDAVSLAKKISVHSSVTISAVVRVIDVHNFMLDFFLTLMIFRFPILQKIIISIWYSITNGHRICAHTAE